MCNCGIFTRLCGSIHAHNALDSEFRQACRSQIGRGDFGGEIHRSDLAACNFRDNLARVKSIGAVVLGVSADSVKRHAKFAEAEGLNFPLLADEAKTTLEAYGVWQQKSMMGKKYMGIVRTTLLIDPEGMVRKIYDGVKVNGHVDEVLADLKALQS